MAQSPSQKRRQESTTRVDEAPPPTPPTPQPQPTPPRPSSSMFYPLTEKIVERVVLPDLVAMVRAGEFGSVQDLFDHYRRETGTSIPDETLMGWLEKHGISFCIGIVGEQHPPDPPQRSISLDPSQQIHPEHPELVDPPENLDFSGLSRALGEEEPEEITPPHRAPAAPPVRSAGPSGGAGPAPLPGGLPDFIHDQQAIQSLLQ